jgi:uncharacterized protein (DUF2336 family)
MTFVRPLPDYAAVRRMLKASDPIERARDVGGLCEIMDRAPLTPADTLAAQEILRVLAEDVAEVVRAAVSVTLKASDLLPRDVALRLARDADAVALPLLVNSPVFTDQDLIDVIAAGEAPRQIAVARRPKLSAVVCAAIADQGVEEAVRAACSNDNADFDARSLDRVVERFPGSEPVVVALAGRRKLPPAIADKLLTLAADSLREHLITRYGLSPSTSQNFARDVRERASLDILERAASVPDMTLFLRHLNAQGGVTASFLLRAAARGMMSVFEHGISVLAGVPHERTWLMIHDGGPLGLRAIYDRAGLPSRLFPAFRSAVDAWRSARIEMDARDPHRFQAQVLERFLSQNPYVSDEDREYLLEKLDQAPGTPRSGANAA